MSVQDLHECHIKVIKVSFLCIIDLKYTSSNYIIYLIKVYGTFFNHIFGEKSTELPALIKFYFLNLNNVISLL